MFPSIFLSSYCGNFDVSPKINDTAKKGVRDIAVISYQIWQENGIQVYLIIGSGHVRSRQSLKAEQCLVKTLEQ